MDGDEVVGEDEDGVGTLRCVVSYMIRFMGRDLPRTVKMLKMVAL